MDIANTIPTTAIPQPSSNNAETSSAVANSASQRSEVLLDTMDLLANAQIGGSSISDSGGGSSTISNANGAPRLDGVQINFSAEDLAATLLVLQGKTQEAQLRTAKEGLQISRDKMKIQHEKAIKKLDECIKKCASAASKSKLGKIFGWVAKVASFVAAAVSLAALTAITGGAAAPLMVLAIAAMVGSAISMASSISQELGGPPLELSSLTTMACKAFLGAVGVPADKLESAAKLMGGALALGLAPGSLLVDNQLLSNVATGIAELGGANQTTCAILSISIGLTVGLATAVVGFVAGGGAGVQKTTDVLKTIADATKAASAITEGAFTAASGAMQIGSSFDQHRADMAQVDRQKFSALLVKLQAQMQEDQEQIKKVVQEMQDGYSAVSQMIASAGESRAQISVNLGQRAMA